MSTSATSPRLIPPAILYRLAGEVVRLRHAVEREYLDADPFTGEDALFPPELDERFQAIEVLLETAIRAANDHFWLDALKNEVRSISARVRLHWLSGGHRDALLARQTDEGGLRGDDAYLDWLALSCPLVPHPCPTWNPFDPAAYPPAPPALPAGTIHGRARPRPGEFDLGRLSATDVDSLPLLAPPRWRVYLTAALEVERGLPRPHRPLFRLGRVLAEVRYPAPGRFNAKRGRILSIDFDRLNRSSRWAVQRTIRAAQERLGLLKGVFVPTDTPDLRTMCIEMDDIIRQALPVPVGTGDSIKVLPSWDGDKVWYPGEEEPIREVAGQATGVRKILDAFQNEGWLEEVRIDETPAQLRDWCRSANKGLRRIRFRLAETAKCVRWEPLGVSDGSAATG